MIETKQSKDNIISIQQAWLKAIDRVAESLSKRYMLDVNDPMREGQTGQLMVIESIIALQCLLVDYGEAYVRSEVDKWQKEHRQELKDEESRFERMLWYRDWFDFMIKTLNKYSLLFETMPRGYSNTTLTSV